MASKFCKVDNKVKLHKGVAENIIATKTCKAELRYYYCEVCGYYHLTSKQIEDYNKPHTVYLHHFKEFLKYL